MLVLILCTVRLFQEKKAMPCLENPPENQTLLLFQHLRHPLMNLHLSHQAREGDNEKASLKEKLKSTREPDSAATPAPLTPPAELVIIAAVQDGFTTSLTETEQPTSNAETNSAKASPPPAPRTSPTEPPCIAGTSLATSLIPPIRNKIE